MLDTEHLACRIPVDPGAIHLLAVALHELGVDGAVGPFLQHQEITLGIGEAEGRKLRITGENMHGERLGHAFPPPAEGLVFENLSRETHHHRCRLEKVDDLTDNALLEFLE